VNSLYPVPVEDDTAYYTNITGILRGKWHRIPKRNANPFLGVDPGSSNDEEIPESRTFSAQTDWGIMNYTYRDTILGPSGKLSLDLTELDKNSTIQFLEGTLTVAKPNGDVMYDAKLSGVHFPENGEAILTTTSPKKYFSLHPLVNARFEGLSMLPFFTSSNASFVATKNLIIEHLEKSLERHNAYQSSGNDDSPSFRGVQCDIIVFISVLPLSGITAEELALYEEEMRYPTGQRVIKPPPMELSGVIYSPDCGTALEWRDEPAVKVEKFWRAGRIAGTVGGLISAFQVWCVIKEMAERGSPSVTLLLFSRLIVERQ